MGLPAGTAGLKRHISITMEFASQARTISPVPDISRYAESGWPLKHVLGLHLRTTGMRASQLREV